jgi:RND family efflux transporter MFP subunit
MNNKIFRFCLVITSSVFITSCGDSKSAQQKAPPPVAVSVYAVKKEAAVYFDQYPATVVPLNQVDLRAQVTGYITGIYFQDGQSVKKGQKLYDIDKQQYEANYSQAVANMAVAQASLDKAQQDADRYSDLLKQDAVARQIYDHAIADLQAAKMQVAATKASVDEAAINLKYSVITASYNGTIGISQVKLGTLVTANQTLLNSISSDDPMAVDIAIDQEEIPRFETFQLHPPNSSDSVFTLSLPGNFIYPQTGSVSFIDRTVDPQTGTIKVRLLFPNTNSFLKAGMTCNVRIKNNGNDATFILAPYKSVVEQLGEYFVFVANNNQAIQHKVILGAKINDKVVVKSGLEEGDSVVTEGVQKLRDSAAIQIGAPKK